MTNVIHDEYRRIPQLYELGLYGRRRVYVIKHGFFIKMPTFNKLESCVGASYVHHTIPLR